MAGRHVGKIHRDFRCEKHLYIDVTPVRAGSGTQVALCRRYTDGVNGRDQHRWFGLPTWILALVGVLALLLVAAVAIHPMFVPLCCVLLPIFLFGRLEDRTRWVPASHSNDVLYRSEPDRPALFQRPPPLFA